MVRYQTVDAYKLLRLRRDGTLGPLFIGKRLVIPVGTWLKAEPIRTPGYAFRPGWHACSIPKAPHLSETGRVWCQVSLRGVTEFPRPESQGGLWFIAEHMRVDRVL